MMSKTFWSEIYRKIFTVFFKEINVVNSYAVGKYNVIREQYRSKYAQCSSSEPCTFLQPIRIEVWLFLCVEVITAKG